MRFRISHLALSATTVAFALVMRTAASRTHDERLLTISALVVSVVVPVALRVLGLKIGKSIIFGTIASASVIAMHYIECLMNSASTEYVWKNPYFASNPEIYVAGATIIMLTCLIAASISTYLTPVRDR